MSAPKLPDAVEPVMTHMMAHGKVAQIHEKNPFALDCKIVRMFNRGDFVELYSISNDGTALRHTIPMDQVHMIQEMMGAEMFIEEMTEAENEKGDDDEDDLDDKPADPAADAEPEEPTLAVS